MVLPLYQRQMQIRKIRALLGASLIVMSSLSWLSLGYAEETCLTCTSPPGELELYFETVREIINLVDIQADDTPDTDVGELAADTVAALRGSYAALLIATNLTWDELWRDKGGVFSDLQMLASSESRQRDREELLEIDYLISRRLYNLQVTQDNFGVDPVPREHLEKFDLLLQKLDYVRLNSVQNSDTYIMELDEVKRSTMLKLARKLNLMYKELHKKKYYASLFDKANIDYYAPSSDPDEEIGDKQEVEGLDKAFKALEKLNKKLLAGTFDTLDDVNPRGDRIDYIEVDQEAFMVHVWQIADAYDCSTELRNQCAGLAEIKRNQRQVTKDSIVKEGGEAVDTFVDALGRLNGLFWWAPESQKQATKQRKEALLQSNWNQQDVDADNGYVRTAGRTVKNMRKALFDSDKIKRTSLMAGDTIEDAAPTSKAPKPDDYKAQKKYEDEQAKKDRVAQREAEKENRNTYRITKANFDLRNTYDVDTFEAKAAALEGVFDSVQALQIKMERSLVYTDSRRVTKQFPLLSAYVHKNIQQLGKKNQEGTLINSMGQICELQCTNLQGRCWYYKE